ncbi:MAG: VWA domain-containing protein [Gammaproteobacteria bacterium]|nr:VWA domain-containing protein [Gammaproteobacteria bacterium]
MPADFHWIRPAWLLAIPVVVAVAVLLARRQLGAGHWRDIIDPALMPYVLSRTPGRGSDYRWWLLGLAGIVASAALAGPAWQRIDQPVFRSDQAMVVALDLSRSMDAQDIAPSRLARAKLKILGMLDRRQGGQTALLVYTANAYTVTPLTDDADTIGALVNSLSTDIMPSRGSYPEAGIRKGQSLLEQAGVGYGEVLLIADGGSSPAAEKAARDLKAAGFSLSVLGVGTREGAPIPRQSGGFVTDNRGSIAVARLEERGLRDLAVAGGGRFAVLTSDDSDLEHLLSGEVRAATAASDDSMASDQWREEGPWLVLLLLPLAALAFRKGWVLVLVVFIMPYPQPAEASLWDDLWLNKNQQAQRALEEGKPADAAALFDDTEWRGVARYQSGDYAGSAEEFAERADTRNLYNLGNAMAQQGEFDSAIDVYEQVLEIEPDNEDARYNLDLVRNIKEQQDQQTQGDDQQSTENPGGEGEQSGSDSQQNQEGSEGSSDSQQQADDGDPSQREQEMTEEDLKALQEELERAAEEAENSEQPEQLSEAELAALRQQQEQQQAMEQWLRRIPDDPGGLLRRKFRYQYQRYGKDQEGRDVWPDDEVQPW